MKVSVIIPVFKEAGGAFANRLRALCLEHSDMEVIVVDGENEASTISHLPDDVKRFSNLRLVKTAPGRGVQLAMGVRVASGEVLVFIHADTRPPQNFGQKICTAIEQKNCQAGAFRFKLDASGFRYRLIEWGVWLRCFFFKLPYGDQIIFVQRDLLQKIGGIKPLPMMEDLELIFRLKKNGVKIHLLKDPAVTSARRWQAHGAFKTTFRNILYLFLSKVGVKVEKIIRLEKYF